ncbi:hypothetical protein K8354_16880 [Polaribacter litorisediminis]|uniref:hypothetical protein n=1 Tax=Polaribacter litorisediminis TaxID=1908341 RepID=UPI001CBBC3FB|nr:hypothetical protein [Polaribacter litorisediminis]UAM97939.1 hypothetical protein K8354_16880 [Polaribacter litorisediminis]
MKEIVFDSFKNTLQEVQILNDIVKKEKVSKSELVKGLKRARDLLFSSYSSLNIFSEAIKSEVSIGYKLSFNDKKQKKKVSKNEAKVIYNKLLSITKSELNKNIIVPKESLILQNQISSMALSLFSASIDEDFQKYNSSFNSENLSLQELSKSINKYFDVIVRYIENILLYDVFLIFEKPEITYLQEIKYTKDYKKEYIDKWLNCSVELSDYRLYKRKDHWQEIFKLDLDSETIEKIEKHQKKLFDEEVNHKVNSEIQDINELKETDKKAAIENNIKLIEDFFNGVGTKTTLKRLKNILRFVKHKQVLVDYDNLLKNYILPIEYLVFKIGKSDYSSIFVASFFLKYLDELKEYLNSLEGNVNINPTINNQFQYENFKDLLLVEELEKRIAIEAVEYKKNCDDYWETYTFDPTYFDTFISGKLYNVFLNAIYERIKPLNDFEINKYLTLSVNQFNTHTPTKRADIFKRIYHDTYWYPNYMEYNPNQYENKYPVHVWKHYTNHFHLFKEASENILQDFKKGLIGNGKKQEVIEKPKTKTKSKYQSFTYINNLSGQSNLTGLKDSLIRKKLIASDTDLRDFRKVFSGEEIEKPIVWTGNISELSYFIKQLHNELKLVRDLKQQQWAVTINCFIQENGEQYNRTKLRTQKVPATSKNIDMALKTL